MSISLSHQSHCGDKHGLGHLLSVSVTVTGKRHTLYVTISTSGCDGWLQQRDCHGIDAVWTRRAVRDCSGVDAKGVNYCTVLKTVTHWETHQWMTVHRAPSVCRPVHRQTDTHRDRQELLMFANVMACYTDLANNPQVHRAPSVSRPVHQTTQEVSRYNSHYYNHRQLSHQWSTNDISMTTAITL